jgi:hypothetical protein
MAIYFLPARICLTPFLMIVKSSANRILIIQNKITQLRFIPQDRR